MTDKQQQRYFSDGTKMHQRQVTFRDDVYIRVKSYMVGNNCTFSEAVNSILFGAAVRLPQA